MVQARKSRREWAHQTSILLYFWKSDAPFRVLSSLVVLGLLMGLSDFQTAFWVFMPVMAFEVCIFAIVTAYSHKRFQITPRVFFGITALNALINMAYTIPAFGFYQIGTWSANFVGVLWLAGITIYTASTYRGIQIFFWVNYLPGAVALLASTLVFYWAYEDSTSVPEWLIAFMATLLYLFNGLEIYRRQREVQKQLDQARKDADSRLMELEYLSQFDP
ncbi:MAG: hypothetical protein AAF429_13220, partial [Pseudomonadota bacterium]